MMELSRVRSMDDPLFMSSSRGPPEILEELKCPVCLAVFTDPVSTPCGHNFCKSCLNKCWDNSQNCSCPLCKYIFSKRPNLKINTVLSQFAQRFKERLSLRISEVLCDICVGRKMKALKSCLECQTSYCKTHLEPHLRVPNFKKHKLMNPVNNISDYICQKHERPLELFCRNDWTCICVFCTDGDHKTHITVPLQDEIKTQTQKTQKDMQQMIKERMKKIQDIKHSAELRKKITEREKASNNELFSFLILSIERCQAELLEMIEEKQKAAEKQDKELIHDLHQEITELKIRNTELNHLSQTEDHLQFLKIYPSICRPSHSRNWPEISINTNTFVSVETLRRALTQLQKTLDEKLSQTVLRRMQQHAVDVTLDPETAHPKLILSNDGKQVRTGDAKRNLPNNLERFDKSVCVLGKEAFLSGRFYFEVQVKGKSEWDLGVARESVNRKGEITVSPPHGFWAVLLRNENEYWVNNDPINCERLSIRENLQKVGVFVDYEEGLVSFYDVESRSHIYSFTGQSFINRLHPYFCPSPDDNCNSTVPMNISPINYSK